MQTEKVGLIDTSKNVCCLIRKIGAHNLFLSKILIKEILEWLTHSSEIIRTFLYKAGKLLTILEIKTPVSNYFCNKICNQTKITMNMCFSGYRLAFLNTYL